MPGRPTGPAGAVPSCGPNGAVAYLAAERRCITTTTTAATTTTAVVGKRVPILAKLLMAPHGAIQKGPLQTCQKVESFQWPILLLRTFTPEGLSRLRQMPYRHRPLRRGAYVAGVVFGQVHEPLRRPGRRDHLVGKVLNKTLFWALIEPALFDTDTDCAGVALVRRALLLLRRKVH
jgi:hypothetical protein